MKKPLLITIALLCSLYAISDAAETKEYIFTVSNASKTAYCTPIEIKILNNGQQVTNGFSSQPLNPSGKPQIIKLKADYCTQIQLKTVCSNQVNLHTKGCSSGTVVIVSPTEMNY
jgi:hypothetical protein